MKRILVTGVAAAAVFGYSYITGADRDASGAIVGAGQVSAFDIRVGDCFDDAGAGDEFTSLPAVPCADAHDNEVYAVFDTTLTSYPGEEQMWESAQAACLDRFEPFVGRDYESSSLDLFAMYPTDASWSQQNDREVVCAVYDMNGGKLEGSVRGLSL